MSDVEIISFNMENKGRFDLNKILSFYIDAGWWGDCSEKDEEIIYKMLEGSFIFAGIFLSGKLIGMARVISDGVSDAYIQDVFVLKKHRDKGLGLKVIDFLIKNMKEKGIDWIGLIGRPGTGYFYEKCGFSQMKDFIPMKY